MNDTQTGDYIIQYYTKRGKKQKDFTEVHTGSLMESKELGEETIESQGKDPLIHSFTIDKRIVNSLDKEKY